MRWYYPFIKENSILDTSTLSSLMQGVSSSDQLVLLLPGKTKILHFLFQNNGINRLIESIILFSLFVVALAKRQFFLMCPLLLLLLLELNYLEKFRNNVRSCCVWRIFTFFSFAHLVNIKIFLLEVRAAKLNFPSSKLVMTTVLANLNLTDFIEMIFQLCNNSK